MIIIKTYTFVSYRIFVFFFYKNSKNCAVNAASNYQDNHLIHTYLQLFYHFVYETKTTNKESLLMFSDTVCRDTIIQYIK